MDSYHNNLMIYLLKKTELRKIKDKEFIRDFINNFNENLNKCSICNEIIFQCKYLHIKKNYQNSIKNFRMKNKHKCLICNNIFNSKNKENVNDIVDIIKKEFRYYDFRQFSSFDNSYFQLYIDLFNFINDFVLFLSTFNNDLMFKIKSNSISKEKFIQIMMQCKFLNNLIGYILKEENNSTVDCRCELCTMKINELQASKLTNIVYNNILSDDYKKATLNDYMMTRKLSDNYDIYFREYIFENRYLIFSIFRKDKDPINNSQWDNYFEDENLFNYLKESKLFIKLIGIIRYFIIHMNENNLNKYNYESLLIMDHKSWEKLFTITYNKSSSKTDKIIYKDCKVALNIFFNLSNIKYSNLKKYLNEDIKYNLIEVIGRIVKYWIIYSRKKSNLFYLNDLVSIDIIMNKIHIEKGIYDYLKLDNKKNLKKIINRISNIFCEIQRILMLNKNIDDFLEKKRNLDDTFKNISKKTHDLDMINVDKLDSEIDENEYSPERIQKEIDLLKKSFNK